MEGLKLWYKAKSPVWKLCVDCQSYTKMELFFSDGEVAFYGKRTYTTLPADLLAKHNDGTETVPLCTECINKILRKGGLMEAGSYGV